MNLILTVTPQEAEVVGLALNELPRRISEPVFAKLQQQIARQQAEQQRREAPPEPEPVIMTGPSE